MQASEHGRDVPRAGPAHLYLALSEDPDSPLLTKPSVARTGLLALAAAALLAAPPLFWAVSAEGATPLVATLATKDGAPGGSGPDDGPSGDDPDGTTAPGMTTSVGAANDTSNGDGVTSAPGVTTAPGATSAGGKTADKPADTTIGEDTSTQAGQLTSDGGQDTGTTAGETDEPGPVSPPEQPVTPPEQPAAQQPPAQQPPAQQPAAVAPPGVTPPAQQPGQLAVLPTRALSPTARLRGASGCPTQAFFARVTGRGIARVTFTVDGRRVATLRRPDARGVWKLRVNPARYSVGKHRVVARVLFDGDLAKGINVRQSASQQQTVRVLSITFSRCARQAARPTFTG